MTALEKYLARRRKDGIGPDAMTGPAPVFAKRASRSQQSRARRRFHDQPARSSMRKPAQKSIAV